VRPKPPTRFLPLLVLALLAPGAAAAHPLAPSLLELRALRGGNGDRFEVLWKTPLRLPADVQIEPALPAHCRPTSPPESRQEDTGVATRWVVECGSEGLSGARLGVAGLMPRGTGAVVRVELGAGELLQSFVTAARPYVTVPAHPSAAGVLRDYVRIGIEHLWFGFDHVLFVLGLLLLVHSRRALLLTVTAFTLGHSVTLSVVALGLVDVPSSVVEVAIAGTLVLLAVELVPGERRSHSLFGERPWRMAFGFGLLHGLGFAGALSEVGLPRAEIPLALLSFNAGIELGQLALIACAFFARALFRPMISAMPDPLRGYAAAYGIGGLAGFWLVERASTALLGA
jgi:hypothetical protein